MSTAVSTTDTPVALVNVETLGPIERRIELVISPETLKKQVDERIKRIAKNVRMPGFRPGKVPLNLVMKQYGGEAHMEAINEELNRLFGEQVRGHKLRVAGVPQIEAAKPATEPATEDGAAQSADAALAELRFLATFDVYPEINLGDAAVLEVDRFEFEVGDAEIDRTLNIMREQRATFEQTETAAEKGDKVTIDFRGTIDGEPFDGGTAEDYAVNAGMGEMLPEFDQALIGVKAGDTRNIELSFPEDYGSKAVAGKLAKFEITCKQVERRILPTVDDDFAKAMGVADGGVEKMRQELADNLRKEVKARLQAKTKTSVMDALVAWNDFPLPKALVEAEIDALKQQLLEEWRSRGLKDMGNFPLPNNLFQERAERRVRLGLMVGELVRQNSLQSKPEQVRAHIEEVAQSYEDPTEVMQWYFADRRRLADVEALVLENNVVDWVLERAKVTAKQVTFDELMEKQ